MSTRDKLGTQKARAFYNWGSGNPFWAHAAISVLRIRQTMVIAPTPPGTGVIAPAMSLAAL